MSIETLFSSNIIVPIVVAFIGFLIAVTTAVIAKEQKVSEFRQAWIDDFRSEVSELLSLCYNATLQNEIFDINKENKSTSDQLSDINSYLALYTSVEKMAISLKLRLNKKEHSEIINQINLFLRNNNPIIKETIYQKISSLEIIEDLAHKILKHEWERVKRGEKRFICFVTVGEFFGGVFFTAFFVLFYLAIFPQYFPGIN